MTVGSDVLKLAAYVCRCQLVAQGALVLSWTPLERLGGVGIAQIPRHEPMLSQPPKGKKPKVNKKGGVDPACGITLHKREAVMFSTAFTGSSTLTAEQRLPA